ncbi:MAG: hypothetical protein IPJ50_16480 [Betaproteobacteria bacterium]|nr:hypothetical protein [Betaproteobacteria bacterium]
MAGVGQGAVADADLDDRHGGNGFALDAGAVPEKPKAPMSAGAGMLSTGGVAGRTKRSSPAAARAPSQGRGGKEPGLAIDQNVEVTGKALGWAHSASWACVFDIPGGHAGRRGLPAHCAVAFAGGDEFEALEVGAPPGAAELNW